MELLHFREAKNFTEKIIKLFSDDDYARFQWFLCNNPDYGDIIVGGGGIRKIRWSAHGHGKRGGARIIYYLEKSEGEIFFLDIYTKNEKADLSKEDLKKLKKELKDWLR